jgi:hypothetical protein
MYTRTRLEPYLRCSIYSCPHFSLFLLLLLLLPYAERRVSAAVSNRISQKAELMQYLAGHASTVGHMLGSIPEQNATSSTPAQGSFAATAPAAVYNMPTCPGTSPLPTAAAAAAGARRSSVSAYLQGQQDLLTTITDGVPYASDMVSLGGAGRFSTASCCSGSSILSAQSAGGPALAGMRMSVDPSAAAAAAGAAANSRHSAVKEALSARISTAGKAPAIGPDRTQLFGVCV